MNGDRLDRWRQQSSAFRKPERIPLKPIVLTRYLVQDMMARNGGIASSPTGIRLRNDAVALFGSRGLHPGVAGGPSLDELMAALREYRPDLWL